jgi:hypothetical protein
MLQKYKKNSKIFHNMYAKAEQTDYSNGPVFNDWAQMHHLCASLKKFV